MRGPVASKLVGDQPSRFAQLKRIVDLAQRVEVGLVPMVSQIKLGDIVIDVVRKDIKNVHLRVHLPAGSLYPALHRIARKGWIEPRWGVSDTGRRARFYELTDVGRERLASEVKHWRLYAGQIDRVLSVPSWETD